MVGTGILEVPSVAPAQAEGAPAPRQLDGVQILRGVAASLVVFHHYCLAFLQYGGRSKIAEFHKASLVGASGVDIFFCISGFVITYSLLTRSGGVSWKAFAIARAKRILPLYWIFTLAVAAVWVTHFAFKSLIVTPELIIRSLLLLPLTKHVSGEALSSHPMLDQGWTLQYEAFFYLICTIVILVFGSKRVFPWAPFLVLFCAGLARLIPGIPLYLGDPLMLEFVGGTTLGWLTASGRLGCGNYRKLAAWSCICTGGIFIVASMFMPDPEGWRVLNWGIPGFLIVLGSVLCTPARHNIFSKVAIFLGVASYSIYLGHGFIVLLVSTAMKKGLFVGVGDVAMMSATVVTIGLSSLFYLVVERPLTNMIK